MVSPSPTKSHTCPWWLIFTFDNPLRKLVHNPKSILAPYVDNGDTVLDVGCGMGYFSLGLARLVGEEGIVIAADLQGQMLDGLRKRAHKAGLLDRIQLHQSHPERLGVHEPLDFALAFWMVHEVKNPAILLREIFDLLVPGGRFLVIEPKIHVSKTAFERMTQACVTVGFSIADHPVVRASRSILLLKEA